MKKVLNFNFRAGSRNSNEPRLIGDILAEMFSSGSPLAKAIRQSVASHKYADAEGKAAAEDADAERKADAADNSGWFRNTELCSDIKTYLCFDRIAKIGKVYKGLLRRDSDEHFSFLECRRSASCQCQHPQSACVRRQVYQRDETHEGRTYQVQLQGGGLWWQIQPHELRHRRDEGNNNGF